VVDEDRDERDPTPEIDRIGFAGHSIHSGPAPFRRGVC
jgi:hypothetical protein